MYIQLVQNTYVIICVAQALDLLYFSTACTKRELVPCIVIYIYKRLEAIFIGLPLSTAVVFPKPLRFTWAS